MHKYRFFYTYLYIEILKNNTLKMFIYLLLRYFTYYFSILYLLLSFYYLLLQFIYFLLCTFKAQKM